MSLKKRNLELIDSYFSDSLLYVDTLLFFPYQVRFAIRIEHYHFNGQIQQLFLAALANNICQQLFHDGTHAFMQIHAERTHDH